MAAIYPQSPPAEDMAGVFLSWRRPPASHAITGSKEGGFYAGTSATDADAGNEFCRLVMGVDDSLGGVVRLNGTLYPAFAVPSADNSQLVISALTDKGLRYAGYGVAVNHDADSHISPAPELMEFHLKTREAPLFAAVNTPEKQPDHLFRSLGFNRTWDEWRREEDARTHATERRHDRGWSQ